VAALLRRSLISPSGALEEPYYLSEKVYLAPQDVRQLQLGKAAIAAGIEIMCKQSGIRIPDIQKLYLAGGFGAWLVPEEGATIGLIPSEFVQKTQWLGNTSLGGAAAMVFSLDARARASQLATSVREISLTQTPAFTEAYMDHMMFIDE
jgi:uncharacterized 2Fe-2S/4Fe-4S cluster protein (DUF4445 family)